MDNACLRLMRENDFDGFHEMMSDFDIVKMSMSWPFPPDPEFTRQRMQTEEVKSGQALAIEHDGQFAGQISISGGELGYMLAKPFWGKGLATWAVREMLARAFADPKTEVITAGTWGDNPASMAVLHKCGFQKTGEAALFCKPRGMVVNGPDFELSRAAWARAQPLALRTDRLTIEPFDGSEAVALSALMNDPEIASMMATIPHPFKEADAAAWLAARVFTHAIGSDTGFVAKVCLHDGTLVGFVGIGGAPVNTAYAFGRAIGGRAMQQKRCRPFWPIAYASLR